MDISGRKTLAKEASLRYIAKTDSPFRAQDLMRYLESEGITVNKTTVYRQLESFLSDNVISAVNLNDGVTRYEPSHNTECHHHIVCKQCGKVAHIELGNSIHKIESELSKSSSISFCKSLMA